MKVRLHPGFGVRFTSAQARIASASSTRETLCNNLLRFSLLTVSDDLVVRSVIPLLKTVHRNESDKEISLSFYTLVTHPTPSPLQLHHLDQKVLSFNISSFVNASENRKQFGGTLKKELLIAYSVLLP